MDLPTVIDRDGWAVVTFSGGERAPDYAYSVGFFGRYQHPEIIMLGLPVETLEEIVNTLGESIREGQKFSDGARSAEILEGYEVVFREVSTQAIAKYFGVAIEHYGGPAFPALQCIWPDRAGRYPGERKTRPGFTRVQPILANGLAQGSGKAHSDE